MRLLFAGIVIFVHSVASAQELPVPQGLRGELVQKEDARYIQLTWSNDPGSPGLGYNLLVKFPEDDDFLLYQKAGIIYDTTYFFYLSEGISATYEFSIMSIKNFPNVERSKPGESIRVTTPSSFLPNIEIENSFYKNGEITLGWNYEHSIDDLKGYNIYLNGKFIDSMSKPDEDKWSGKFQDKGTYIFELTAVSLSGVESRKSQKAIIKIE